MPQYSVLGPVDDLGRLYTYPGAPTPGAPFRGGIGYLQTQRTCIANVSDGNFVNGFMVNNDGSLVIAQGGAIASFHMGFPRTVDGKFVGQLDTIPAAGDPYVNGVRVGLLGGVYATSAVPFNVSGFSSGFSNGYGP